MIISEVRTLACESVIMNVFHQCLQSVDQGRFVVAIFVNSCRAFETLSRDL